MSALDVLRCQRCGAGRGVGAWREPSTPWWSRLCGACKLTVTFRVHPWLSIMASRDEGAAARGEERGLRTLHGEGETPVVPSSVPATDTTDSFHQQSHRGRARAASAERTRPGRLASRGGRVTHERKILDAPTTEAAIAASREAIAMELGIERGLGPASGLPAWVRVGEVLALLAKRARRDEAAALVRAQETITELSRTAADQQLVGREHHQVRS